LSELLFGGGEAIGRVILIDVFGGGGVVLVVGEAALSDVLFVLFERLAAHSVDPDAELAQLGPILATSPRTS